MKKDLVNTDFRKEHGLIVVTQMGKIKYVGWD